MGFIMKIFVMSAPLVGKEYTHSLFQFLTVF